MPPAADRSGPDPARTDPPSRPPSGLRALVVEDEIPLASLLSSYLQRGGFDVHVVHDGLVAVATAREVDPDVVVLDLGLPGLDGIEVCREIRTFTDAYVVILTARSEEVDTLIGLSVGADDYMSKPFSPRELMARVDCHAAPTTNPASRTGRRVGPAIVWAVDHRRCWP